MDVRTLKYFVLVAEEGSIHGGARRALVAQPALSVALRKLERELGTPLFERSPRGVALTPAGDALLLRARRILHDVQQATVDVRLTGERPRPEFTVGLIEGRVAAGELTGPILDAFQAAHPDLHLRVRELNFVEQFDAVLEGRVDVALVRSPYEHEQLCLEPLFSEPVVLAASPAHPLAVLPEVPLDRALDEPLLEVVRTPRAWRRFWAMAELGNGTGRRTPSQAIGLLDYCVDVMRNSTVSPMSLSAWRLGALGGTSLRALQLSGAPHSAVGVGYRRGADGAHATGGAGAKVRAFAEVARAVTEQLIDIVPDAVLLPAQAGAGSRAGG
jgi:DNA-binding transcriptional LysR family regulator